MASRSLGALALFLLSTLAPAFLSQAPVASRLRPLPTQAALERAPMRAWPFGPAPTSARPWSWRQLGAVRDNAVFLTLTFAALSYALNFGNSPQGRVRRAAKTMMKPFRPELAKDRVSERDVVGSITERIENWTGHATVIAGRFGSGKTVALEAALRDRRGVYVHIVKDKDWENSLYKDLGLDNLGMLKDALRLVKKRNGGSTPILVLDIPRSTKEGMDTVSTFAKILSTDSKLAHVIVCASSAAMAISFDAGGSARQKDIWVGDLTEKEAKELLTLHEHQNDWKQFVDACGFNALDLVDACRISVEAKKAEMEKRAREEVQVFKDQCKVAGDTGKEILKELLANWQAGKGADRLCTAAFPKDVAMWIREKDCHPVIWHTVREEYQFASDRHAKVATETLNSTSQSTT